MVDGVNGWEEYIVADCGIKAKDKAEEDASIMAMRKQALLDRIQNEAARRDAGSPATVADTQRQGRPSMAYRLNGSKLWLIGNGQSGYPWGGWGYGEGWWF